MADARSRAPRRTCVYRSGDLTTLLGVSQSGLLSSSKGGQDWRQLASPGRQVASMATAQNGSIIYAGTATGLMRSSDADTTWQPTAFTGTALTVALTPADPRMVAVVDDRRASSDQAIAATAGPVRREPDRHRDHRALRSR